MEWLIFWLTLGCLVLWFVGPSLVRYLEWRERLRLLRPHSPERDSCFIRWFLRSIRWARTRRVRPPRL